MKTYLKWCFAFMCIYFALTNSPVCMANGSSEAMDAQSVNRSTDETLSSNPGDYFQLQLKEQCLAATLTAINLEMDRYQRWIDFRKQQEDQKDLADLQQALADLKTERSKYLAMAAKDYILPEKVDEVAWVSDNPKQGSILNVEDMSRSGPWYVLTGAVGNDFGILKKNIKYHVRFYKLYPRNYFGMNSAYVYVSAAENPAPSQTNIDMDTIEFAMQHSKGLRITGEVFATAYSEIFHNREKCENYKVYLLKDLNPKSEAKLMIDSKQSGFNFVISQQDLKQYSYLEFISTQGNKTVKLSELSDEKLTIILEEQIVVKKPAIYLYPVKTTPITVIHNFKGKILSTYPQYTDKWDVIAEPNGNLLNQKDKRNYKYLFWDGVYSFPQEHVQFKTGFYVEAKDYVQFLQNKLVSIGLTDNEINDFIVYWLPIMNNYKNCFIHFRINDNIDNTSFLDTKPTADTTIRIFMEFTGINDLKGIAKLPEQELPSFTRKGFTLVEWGGAELGNNILSQTIQ